jgi:hypothetical protein
MYRRLPSFVLGFHGCDRTVGEAVLAGDVLAPSTNDYDWLGEGVYFWENSPHRAYSYAQHMQRYSRRTKGTIRQPFVIGAVIDLGLCLNLSDEFALLELESSHKLLAATSTNLPQNIPGYQGDEDLLKRHLDCAVFQNLHEGREKIGEPAYQSVRSPFIEGGPLYAGTRFCKQTHVQLCVRDRGCIKGYFRPLDRDGDLFLA